ncbi:hypothetical protein Tco_1355738 [Tanacetum coccineum]
MDDLEDLPPRTSHLPPPLNFTSIERIALQPPCPSFVPDQMDIKPPPPSFPSSNIFDTFDDSLWINGPPPPPHTATSIGSNVVNALKFSFTKFVTRCVSS